MSLRPNLVQLSLVIGCLICSVMCVCICKKIFFFFLKLRICVQNIPMLLTYGIGKFISTKRYYIGIKQNL